ncbi:MAG: FAD-dependent oxidoreductase [Rubrivivax sp.]|nr:FAD-dependent oxidoreductase [Rubrivivax sp.]
MTHVEQTSDVLVIGAGPVGLSLAMDLAWRGQRVTVLEQRHHRQPPEVKCNHVAARTMEQFRRLGVAAAVRAAGLPDHYPHDVAFRTSVTGTELTRVPIPGRAARTARTTATEGPDVHWPTPEPPHRVNQTFLEPVLLDHAATMPGLTLVNRVQLQSLQQDDAGVVAEVLDLDSGATRRFGAAYLVGCDGGRSFVRKHIGAQLAGTPVIQQVQSTHIRAPGLLALIPGTPAWCFYSVNPRRCGTVFAIDGRETWLVHNHLHPHEPGFDSVDRDWAIREILGVGPDFDYEVLSQEDWVGRRLVADRFRDRRIFICGDAAHLWVPYAGYGMNAGIADAMNLSWHLSARLRGWAGPAVLDLYEQERLPITEQVSRFAMDHAQAMIKARGAVPADIEDAGPEADAVRAELGRKAYALNVQQFACAGLNFGYYYEASPAIAYDDETAPPYAMGSFTASTVPGCRMPHVWLPDGRSLYDAFGPDYTLLRRDPAVDVAPLLQAAQARGVPMTLLDLPAGSAPPEMRHALLLCRTDQHVAWRGDAAPADPLALVDRLRAAA